MTTTPLPEVLTRGAVSAQVLARWGADVADALATAHRRGAAHGDVRADVVHIAPDGSATLEGFGANTGGAPRHPAPERATSPGPSAAADVYALGAMLFQAGGAVVPEMAGVWPWLGHADLAQRPSAANAAEYLRTFAAPAAVPSTGGQSNGVSPTAVSPMAVSPMAVSPMAVPPTEAVSPTAVPSAGLPTSAVPTVFTPTAPVTEPRRNRRGWWIALALILVIVLVGGAVWAARSLLGLGRSSVLDTAAGPIGDVRTADPCSLLNVPILARFGPGRLYPENGAPSTCRIWVAGSGDTGTWVGATLSNPGLDERDLAQVRSQRIGALTLYSAPASDGYCQRTIVLPDRYQVTLDAAKVGAGTQDLCAMADAELPSALSALDGESLPRKTLNIPSNSLVSVPDVCALGAESVLRTIDGLNIGRRERTLGGWSCRWGADPAVVDSADVLMIVRRSLPLAGRPTTIGDRTAVVVQNGWPYYRSSCVVNLIQRSYPGPDGSTVAEYLVVQVHVNDAATPEAHCTAATALAKAAGAQLPSPN